MWKPFWFTLGFSSPAILVGVLAGADGIAGQEALLSLVASTLFIPVMPCLAVATLGAIYATIRRQFTLSMQPVAFSGVATWTVVLSSWALGVVGLLYWDSVIYPAG